MSMPRYFVVGSVVETGVVKRAAPFVGSCEEAGCRSHSSMDIGVPPWCKKRGLPDLYRVM